jgi:hypothetical protein
MIFDAFFMRVNEGIYGFVRQVVIENGLQSFDNQNKQGGTMYE